MLLKFLLLLPYLYIYICSCHGLQYRIVLQWLVNTPSLPPPLSPVSRLVAAVLRLCEVERRAVESRLTDYLSPEVGSSLMWFLRRWLVAYLLPNENYYTQVSSPVKYMLIVGLVKNFALTWITLCLPKELQYLRYWIRLVVYLHSNTIVCCLGVLPIENFFLKVLSYFFLSMSTHKIEQRSEKIVK